MTTLIYPDAYLAAFCDDDREERAYAAIDLLDPDGAFTDSWRDALAIVKGYIRACLENQAAPDDLFSTKLKTYTKEFEGLLDKARVATAEAGTYSPIFSIPLERA